MPYLGNIPATNFSTISYQDLTGGTGTSFTLDFAAGSAQDIEVFVNNVRQEPGVAYTVAGTSLTMTGSIVATDDFYVVFQGKAQQSVTHPSNSALQATTGTFSGALSATTGTFSGDLTVDTNTLYVDSTNNRVGVGTASPASAAHISSSTYPQLEIDDKASRNYAMGVTSSSFRIRDVTGTADRLTIDSSGNVLIGGTSYTTGSNISGFFACPDSPNFMSVNSDLVLLVNRRTNDGNLISFQQDKTEEGSISVSGTTVSYNGGHLSRWSQLTDNTRDATIVKGTVLTNLDQMAEWTNNGVTEDNEQLNCMAVSSIEGDQNVAGVFVNWDNDDDIYTNDMNVAMTGDMVIRIAQGTTVARGDLLMSAGDGTAKPQGDDIVRSKTIAKVTSTHVSHTYDDGSYLVPCVLMAC